MIRLGYACINTYLPTCGKTFRLVNYSEERMIETALKNIDALMTILQWNVDQDIRLFRICSGLIPFGSHCVNSGIWKNELKEKFRKTGNFISKNSIRVSMHPGQYTVINSPNKDYYNRSIKDLEYHCAVLDLMELDNSHKVIIHGGGVYQDKQASTSLLIKRLEKMNCALRERIVLENDERNYSAEDIYRIGEKTGLPIVLDIFHHQCLPSMENLNIEDIIMKFGKTWSGTVRQKIHYSNQASGKHKGAHSQQIDLEEFSRFYKKIRKLDLDIMLETKDKQESVLRIKKFFPELK